MAITAFLLVLAGITAWALIFSWDAVSQKRAERLRLAEEAARYYALVAAEMPQDPGAALPRSPGTESVSPDEPPPASSEADVATPDMRDGAPESSPRPEAADGPGTLEVSGAPAAEDAVAEYLSQLRSSEHFLGLSPRPLASEIADDPYDAFHRIVDGQATEWANKEELWNEIAPAIRDEALLLGPEWQDPVWEAGVVPPVRVHAAWSDDQTGGRGQYVEFVVVYATADGPVERYWPVLISTDEDSTGEVVARTDAFDLRLRAFAGAEERDTELAHRTWQWVREQPVASSSGGDD